MADHPLRPATRRSLGEPLPHQQADRPRAHPPPPKLSTTRRCRQWSYPVLAPVSEGYPKVKGRLLTCYSPVRRSCTPKRALPLDLHVLSTPPAFVLSQDQTLHRKKHLQQKTTLDKKQQHYPCQKNRTTPTNPNTQSQPAPTGRINSSTFNTLLSSQTSHAHHNANHQPTPQGNQNNLPDNPDHVKTHSPANQTHRRPSDRVHCTRVAQAGQVAVRAEPRRAEGCPHK